MIETNKTNKGSTSPEKKKKKDSTEKEGWFDNMVSTMQLKWEERPSLSTIQLYHFPIFLAVGAIAIGTFDATFDTKIAEKMKAEQVEKQDGFFERQVEGAIHEIGKIAVDMKDD